MTLNILILDDVRGASAVARKIVPFSSWLLPTECNLYLITSTGGVCAADRNLCAGIAEFDSPTTDGNVELVARAWHEQSAIDLIYTRHEDLLIRAAYLRKLFNINEGMQPETTFAFRDKITMKDAALKGNMPVSKYCRLQSPSCLLQFIKSVGLPVVIKPSLGCASIGVKVLRTHAHVSEYLANGMLRDGDASGKFDLAAGELVAETFVDAPMYHVNGFVRNGRLAALWSFAYLSTNLEFATDARSYGNVSIAKSDPLYDELRQAAEKTLACFCLPQHGAFHLELFHVNHGKHASRLANPVNGSKASDCYFAMCEIAARGPGGSISNLIELLTGTNFAQLMARFVLGLDTPQLENALQRSSRYQVADLLVPHKPMTRILHMPMQETFPFDSCVKYLPMAKVGDEYRTFGVGTLNTMARFVSASLVEDSTFEGMIVKMTNAETWFLHNIVTAPLTDSNSTPRALIGIRRQFLTRTIRCRIHRKAENEYKRSRSLVQFYKPSARQCLLRKAQRKAHWLHDAGLQLVPMTGKGGYSASSRLAMRAIRRQRLITSPPSSVTDKRMVLYSHRAAFCVTRKAWQKNVRGYAQRQTHKPVIILAAAPKQQNQLVHVQKVKSGTGAALLRKLNARIGSDGLDWMKGMRYVVVKESSNDKNHQRITPKSLMPTNRTLAVAPRLTSSLKVTRKV